MFDTKSTQVLATFFVVSLSLSPIYLYFITVLIVLGHYSLTLSPPLVNNSLPRNLCLSFIVFLNLPHVLSWATCTQVPLPESPLPFQPVTPDPMSHVDPPQPSYVHDFTCMLEFINQNQAHFQEQVTWVISALTGFWVTPPVSQALHSGSTVKLHNLWVFNGCHEEVVPFLSEVQHIIKFHPSSFPDDHWKVLFVVMYLKNRIPIEWFNHLEVIGSPYLHNWPQFMSKFWKKFANSQLSSTANQKLEKLKQTGSAHAYLTHFVEKWPCKRRSTASWKG